RHSPPFRAACRPSTTCRRGAASRRAARCAAKDARRRRFWRPLPQSISPAVISQPTCSPGSLPVLEAAGRVVMVCGASRGIGRAVVERLIAGGYRVSAGVRESRGLVGSDHLMLQRYDAEQLPSAEAWVAATIDRFGRLDGLVNAAAINPE